MQLVLSSNTQYTVIIDKVRSNSLDGVIYSVTFSNFQINSRIHDRVRKTNQSALRKCPLAQHGHDDSRRTQSAHCRAIIWDYRWLTFCVYDGELIIISASIYEYFARIRFHSGS